MIKQANVLSERLHSQSQDIVDPKLKLAVLIEEIVMRYITSALSTSAS